ncbi:MAG: hypothetical protein RIF32_06905 [Leptospirales bacterium]|jgi:multidrug efflux pump subunit AcrB
MVQKILRTLLLAISILVAYLLITFAEGWILDQPKTLGPRVGTLIGMVCIVFLFVPLFQWMDRFTQKIVQFMVRTFSSFFGRAGLYLFLGVTLFALYVVYLQVWYQARIF